MRKVLIATIVAMVLFAVGAFAAALSLDTESVASGSADVEECASSPEVEFEVGAYDDNTLNDWPVESVVVTASGCANGTDVEVVLLDAEDGGVLASASGQISNGATPELSFDEEVGAEPVEWYAVLLNGDPVATAPAP